MNFCLFAQSENSIRTGGFSLFTVIFLSFLILTISAKVSFGQSGKIDSLQSLLEEYHNRENFYADHHYINILNRLGELYYHVFPDSTYLLATKSLEQSRKLQYVEGEVDAYRNLGAFYNLKGNYEQAMEFFQMGLPLAEKVDYETGKANIHNSMGLNLYEQGRFTESVANYIMALKIKEKHLPETELTSTLNNLGLVFTDMGNYQDAIKYHERALDIRKRSGDRMGIASTLANLGLIYKKQNRLDEALQNYRSSLDIGKELSNMQLISVSHYNIGDILLEKGQYEEASKNFKSALLIDENLGDQVRIGYDLLGLGKTQFLLGEADQAETLVNRALKLSQESGIKRNISASHELLSMIHESKNDLRSALDHHKLYKIYTDSLLNAEAEKNIRTLTYQFEFDQKEAELKQVQKERDMEREMEKEKVFRNGFILLFFIILTALFISIRSIKGQRKARILVTRQKEELEKLNLEILRQQQKTEGIVKDLYEANKTKDKLFSIVSHDLKSPISSLKGLLQYTVDENLTQEEFSLISTKLRHEVEQVHFTLINLLHWAKNQMKGIKLHPEKLSINELLKEVFDLYQPIAEIKGIKLHDDLLPQTNCFADKEHCLLILRNLVNNAIKFSNKNGNIYVSSLPKENDMWEITVQDEGIGMDENTLKKLFKPDFQKHQYGTAGEKGTGLGLQLSKDFIEQNQGHLWVESTLGRGSKFIFTLPSAK